MIREGQNKPIIIKALIMIDPVTGWFKILQYNDKQADTIANLVNRYQRPKTIMHNFCNKLFSHFFKSDLIQNGCVFKHKCTKVENPQ